MDKNTLRNMSARELQNYRAQTMRFRESAINSAMQYDDIPEELNNRIKDLNNAIYDIDEILVHKK